MALLAGQGHWNHHLVSQHLSNKRPPRLLLATLSGMHITSEPREDDLAQLRKHDCESWISNQSIFWGYRSELPESLI